MTPRPATRTQPYLSSPVVPERQVEYFLLASIIHERAGGARANERGEGYRGRHSMFM